MCVCVCVEANLAVTAARCSLNFASRCRSVALGSAKKNTESGEVAKLKRKVAELSVRNVGGSVPAMKDKLTMCVAFAPPRPW